LEALFLVFRAAAIPKASRRNSGSEYHKEVKAPDCKPKYPKETKAQGGFRLKTAIGLVLMFFEKAGVSIANCWHVAARIFLQHGFCSGLVLAAPCWFILIGFCM
jgi:hypothetical protein